MVTKTTTSTRKSSSTTRASASTPNKKKSMQSRPQTSHNSKPPLPNAVLAANGPPRPHLQRASRSHRRRCVLSSAAKTRCAQR
jgi:hypothetical protein